MRKLAFATGRTPGLTQVALPAFLWGMSLKKVLLAALLLPVVLLAEDKPKITAFERSQGWRLLDASDLRGFRENKLPKNWTKNGYAFTGKAGTALVTAEEFADFELTFDCKVAEGGHGEVFIRVSEDETAPEKSGPVVYLYGHEDQVGGNGLVAPDRKVSSRFGDWSRVKIALFGNEVTCWINGDRVHSYLIGTPDWKKAVAASANPSVAKSANERTGRLAFTGEDIEIRNVKVRSM